VIEIDHEEGCGHAPLGGTFRASMAQLNFAGGFRRR
jgi:hypothetical protein